MCLACDAEAMVFRKVPRKTKKAAWKFLATEPIRWSRKERRRFLRALNRQRRFVGLPPLRYRPDGRVSLLEL